MSNTTSQPNPSSKKPPTVTKVFQLVYASSAVNKFTDDQIVELLKKAREKNKRLNITGLLLYKDGNFMQALEGPEEAVRDLFSTIRQDDRHKGVIVLTSGKVEAREFKEWEMGFANVARISKEKNLEGVSEFLQEGFSSESFQNDRSRVQTFLKVFRDVVAGG